MSHSMVLAASAADTTRGITFWLLAIISVAAGLGMVLARRAVHCAVLLAVVMLSLAVFYAMLGAPFLAFVQVIVYTGAVLMLFLFVMMIVGISSADSIIETIRGQRMAAALAGLGLLVLLTFIVGHAAIGPGASTGPAYGSSNINGLATLIFTRYVFPFEITSALLITAALGAMVLAHAERTSPRPTQRRLSRQRVASGRLAPLPGPGTYARHNGVDMPALLPDGSVSRLSVSPVISGLAKGAGSGPAVRTEALGAADTAGAGTASAGINGTEGGSHDSGPAGVGTAGAGTAGVGTASAGINGAEGGSHDGGPAGADSGDAGSGDAGSGPADSPPKEAR